MPIRLFYGSRHCMGERDPGSGDRLWTAFEAEAMPHVDRLFRLAMWWERDRREVGVPLRK